MERNEFLQSIEKISPSADLALIGRAYDYAKNAHEGQKRLSGREYFHHVAETAVIVAELHLDTNSIAAALLHDVVEDTEHELKDIKKEFGKEIGFLVDGMTKLDKVKYVGNDSYVENWRKMFVSMARDVRVIMIKFADVMHNLQDLHHLPQKTQNRITRETIEIYAPIANRLRLGAVKGRLEDWAFKYKLPQEHRWITQLSDQVYSERKDALEKTISTIQKTAEQSGIDISSIHPRIKHMYSLYRKLLRKDLDIEKVYDAIAIRIIVPSVADCYAILGLIHSHYKPLKGRIKDYIAQPKPNGYRSLHTTVFGENGLTVEVQIRTQEMHDEAEFGVAAHWLYKEQIPMKEKQIQWIQNLASLAKNLKDEESFEDLKINIFKDRIFVFTPKGDVIDLPELSTPVDFAYAIHADIGNTCTRAVINDEVKKLSTILKNNDVVEIVTDKNKKGPNEEWLNFVQTNRARDRIKNYKRKHAKEWGMLKKMKSKIKL